MRIEASADGEGGAASPSNSMRPVMRGPGLSGTITSLTSASPTESGSRAHSVASAGIGAGAGGPGGGRTAMRAPPASTIVFGPSSGSGGGRGMRTALSTYCPEGTPRRVNAPVESLIAAAVSISSPRASLPIGSRRTPTCDAMPSGATSVPEMRVPRAG